jgi:hypothetical protein
VTPQDVAPSRADGGTYRRLVRARGSTGEQQVGDVGAGDEQDESHRAEQDVESRPILADELLVQRFGLETPLMVLLGIALRQVTRDDVQLGRELLLGDSGLEPPEHREVMLVVHGEPLGREGDGDPELLVVQGVVE